MGFYPYEGLTEMDENSYVQNRVGVEMMELDAIMEKQATEEVTSGYA
jgi:hypothetical protein